jgi:phospholipid-binding lipoprotein MlaA
MPGNKYKAGVIVLCTVFGLLSGCAAPGPRDEHDPFEGFNRAMYKFNDAIDRAVMKPVAKGYNKVVPSPVNKGITNFFNNLGDIVVIFNDLLQFKISRAASDTARVFINSTVGLLGFIDVASSLELRKHDEDFGQTLGYWGIETGPYLVLPFLGPSTIRDTFGRAVDWQLDPVYQVSPTNDRYWTVALRAVDTRAGLLTAGKILEEAALDPYLFMRDSYLQRRNNLVHDGNPPPLKFEE